MSAQEPTPAEALVAAEDALSDARQAYANSNTVSPVERQALESELRTAAATVERLERGRR